MKSDSSVSLVIPIYNEERVIASTVHDIVWHMSQRLNDFELILINDGSADKTGEILNALAQQYPQVKVLHNMINLNVGISLQRGLHLATKEFVVHNGIDMPLATEEICSVVDQAKNCDVLVLQRESYAGYTPWRYFCSKLNRALLRILFRCPFADLNFTQVYRRSVIPAIVPLATSPAFTTPEMIIRALHEGLRVTAIPWPYQARAVGRGAFGKPHDLLWSVYDIFRFWIRGSKPLRSPRIERPHREVAEKQHNPSDVHYHTASIEGAL